MWFSAFDGIYQYDGTNVKRYINIPGDSTSPKREMVKAMAGSDRLWVGYKNGISEFNYNTFAFKKIAIFNGMDILKIVPAPDKNIYVVTKAGLVCYCPKTGETLPLATASDTATFNILKHPFQDMFLKGNKLFMQSGSQIVIYDFRARKAVVIEMNNITLSADRLIVDSKNNFWVTEKNVFKLFRISSDGKQVENMNWLMSPGLQNTTIKAAGLEADDKGKVWILTNQEGLIEYDTESGITLRHKHDNLFSGSISTDLLRNIFLSKDGIIWVTGFQGVDYYNPYSNHFKTVLPFADEHAIQLARGFTEEPNGTMWFSTATGISNYNPDTKKYSIWFNAPGKPKTLYDNSVRGISLGDDNTIWIATGSGVNRYHTTTAKMDFLTSTDSLPESFYFNVSRTSDGTVWFCAGNPAGLYYYLPSDKKVHSIANHPVLKQFRKMSSRCILQDSKARLWIGFDSDGLGMYDAVTNTTRYWYNNNAAKESTIIGNNIIDIKEDKKGVIWVSTLDGVTGIDVDRNKFIWLGESAGLPSRITGPLAVDSLNRLWIGTNAGLIMFENDRKKSTSFSETDGLPSLSFPDHQGRQLQNGDILLPTAKGYVYFNPYNFVKQKKEIKYYISYFELFNKKRNLPENAAAPVALNLGTNENFFSFGLIAINYEDPEHLWFHYKLDGFEKEWHVTQDPKAVYTNVPGGQYKFIYRVSDDPDELSNNYKTVNIFIKTSFYKRSWFRLLAAVVFFLAVYLFFKIRAKNVRRVLELQNKAQLLEKEKALVMYENLKQHLNPHFLFNSLSALSSLITIDQKMAGNFLEKMSKVYRYVLNNRDNEMVTLGEELKFVKLYIDLQKTRFEKGLTINMDIDEEYYDRKIAPVTLQNLVENAIKHNSVDPEAPLIIDLFVENDYLVVRNNLQKKIFVETSNKQGLANMESLYCYLSERRMEIKEDGGYFTVKIPLI